MLHLPLPKRRALCIFSCIIRRISAFASAPNPGRKWRLGPHSKRSVAPFQVDRMTITRRSSVIKSPAWTLHGVGAAGPCAAHRLPLAGTAPHLRDHVW